MSKLYNKEDSKFTIAMFDRGIEIGKKQMIEWLENYSNKKIEREEKEGDDLIGEAIIEHYKELISAAKKQEKAKK